MLKIPQNTGPLVKSIRTLEGQLVIALDALIVIVTGFSPTSLPRKEAAIVLTVQHVALLLQRGLVKATALAKGTPLDPILPAADSTENRLAGEALDRQPQIEKLLEELTQRVSNIADNQTPLTQANVLDAITAVVSDAEEVAKAPPTEGVAADEPSYTPPESAVKPDLPQEPPVVLTGLQSSVSTTVGPAPLPVQPPQES